MEQSDLQNQFRKEKLKKFYHINKKRIDTKHEEVKQRLNAVGAKLLRYDNRPRQFKQNLLFKSSQKKVFEEMKGKTKRIFCA